MPNMAPISAQELLSLQSDASNAACDQSCTIQRKNKTKDASGRTSATYSTIATTVCGLSQPTGTQLANYASMIGSLATWQVHFPAGQDIQAQDRVIVAGQTLEINVVLTPQSYSALEACLATEIKVNS